MEITGRLTADATVAVTKTGKEVVSFSIAVNDSYKPKDSSEITEITTYINCSYWRNAKAAQWLRKGTLVMLYGRIGMNVYNNMDGKAVGSLSFHVNDIKVLVFPKSRQDSMDTAPVYNAQPANGSPSADDLPF